MTDIAKQIDTEIPPENQEVLKAIGVQLDQVIKLSHIFAGMKLTQLSDRQREMQYQAMNKLCEAVRNYADEKAKK